MFDGEVPGGELFDPWGAEYQSDPYPIYARLRREAPVYRQEQLDFYALSHFDDIFRALRDPARFSSAKGLTFVKDEQKILGLAPTFIMMDPPDHTRLRRLVSKAFTRDRVNAVEATLRDFVRGRLDRLAAECARSGSADLVSLYSSPIPTHALAEVLGVPEEDRERFDPWSHAITSASMEEEKMQAAVVAVAQLFQYFISLIERRRKEPGDDMLSALVQAQISGDPLTNWDILGFCFVFLAGGNDTTNHLVANGTWLLEAHPEQRALLHREPERIPAAGEEMLRYEAPVQGLSRTAMEDISLHGVTIPEGSKVHLLFGSGNRDARAFGEDAEAFDVRRAVPRHLSFSQGPHFCIGAHLGRLMIRIAFEELLARAPDYELDHDGAQRTASAFVRGFERLPIRLR